MNDKIIVAGRNYCNILTTARALGEAGYRVEVLKVFKQKPNPLKFLRTMKPEAYSKYVCGYKEVVVNGDMNNITRALLDMAEGEKKLVIPVDDYVCYAVDIALDELSESFVLPNVNNTAGAVAELMSKSEQKRIATEQGLPVLSGVVIKSNGGEFEIPNEVKYPCFIKPNVSMLSTKSSMRKCDNEQELTQTLTKLAQKNDFEILCEELADIKQEYSILGVCAGERATAPCAFKVLEGGHRDRKGVTLIGELVNANMLSDIIAQCCRYVESIGYSGMFDIDLIEDKNGKIYFVEMNFRSGASTYAFNSIGVNLCAMLADYYVKGKPIEDAEPVNSSIRFLSEKILMEEFARGDAGFGDIKRCMNSAEAFFVKNENDMKPYRYFKSFYPASAVIRLMYKLKN